MRESARVFAHMRVYTFVWQASFTLEINAPLDDHITVMCVLANFDQGQETQCTLITKYCTAYIASVIIV